MKKLFTSLVLFLVTATSQNAFAAVAANATASPSTTTINHPVQVTVAFQNGTSSALTVSNVQITATSTQQPGSSRLADAFSVWNPNQTVTIAAGPNVVTNFVGGTAVFFTPSTGITGSGSGTYTIGGTVYTSDGSVTPITSGATVTINPIPLPAYERQ